MSLTNTQYDSIQKIYDEMRKKNRLALEARTDYVYAHIDGYKELNDAVGALCIMQAKKVLDGDYNAISRLKEDIRDLKQQKALLLARAGLAPEYLNMEYDCPDCQDTGYIDGKKCHCFKQAMLTILYDQSNMRSLLDNQDFKNVSDRFYKGEDLIHFHDTYEKCLDFTKNFHNDYHNLIFYGTVGTGKSFLSGCIAKELLESGHSVIYFSAASLIDTLSRYNYDYKNRNESNDFYQDIYECDLLIIDDLGTEMTTDYSVSKLFTCLNERFLRKKAIVISTNLSLEELKMRYSDRIFSRLTSNSVFCHLTGPDIRML